MKTDSGSEYAKMHVKVRVVHFSSDVSSSLTALCCLGEDSMKAQTAVHTRSTNCKHDVTSALLLEERKCQPEIMEWFFFTDVSLTRSSVHSCGHCVT